MKDINLIDLYLLKNRLIKEGYESDILYTEVCEAIIYKESIIIEDTSATGGPCVSGGMGSVVSAQPSSLPGSTIGSSWSNGGGTIGSGDVSTPYNTGSSHKMFQKIPAMGYNHGSRTGKKTRKKRFTAKSLQQLRNSLSGRQDYTKSSEKTSKRVMSFDNFQKDDINTIKKD